MKSDREEEIPYTWNIKRNDTNELTKQKETHRLRSKLMIARGRDSYGLWGGHVHTAMFKMGNLLCGTWDSPQRFVPASMGG